MIDFLSSLFRDGFDADGAGPGATDGEGFAIGDGRLGDVEDPPTIKLNCE